MSMCFIMLTTGFMNSQIVINADKIVMMERGNARTHIIMQHFGTEEIDVKESYSQILKKIKRCK